MELTYRGTLLSDVDELFSVRARTRENPMSRVQLAELGVTPDAIVGGLVSGRIRGWVCCHGSNIVGFCHGDRETGEVLVLAVRPEYEGRGIGRNLLTLVVEWLRALGFESLWLAASADANTRAYGFYRSLGWRPNGEMDENGDEVLVLRGGAELDGGG